MKSQSDKLLDQIYRYLRELESGKVTGLKGHGGGSHRSGSHHRGGNFKGNPNKKGKKTTPTNEIKRGAQRVKKYRKLSGKKRLDKETKEALIHFTAKQVYKANTTENIEKVVEKRFTLFNKRYTVDKSETEIKYALKYLTPAQAAKYLDATPLPPDEWEEHYFTELIPPKVDWYDFPSFMRQWSRKNGSFLYNNQGIVFDEGNNNIWEDLLISGGDGYDHTLYEWFTIMTPRKRSGWLFDPAGFNDIFWVKQEEWEKVQALGVTDDAYLDPNFYDNRKYYTRKPEVKASKSNKNNEYLTEANRVRDAKISPEDTVYDSDEWDY